MRTIISWSILKKNMSKRYGTEKGVSNWLTVLPINKYGFELSKQQLWDFICLRYDWEI